MKCYAASVESRAMSALISIAPAGGDLSEAGNSKARNLCAQALREWRVAGDKARAKWLRYHISFVGYPTPPSRLTPENRRNQHEAWKWRYERKFGPLCAASN